MLSVNPVGTLLIVFSLNHQIFLVLVDTTLLDYGLLTLIGDTIPICYYRKILLVNFIGYDVYSIDILTTLYFVANFLALNPHLMWCNLCNGCWYSISCYLPRIHGDLMIPCWISYSYSNSILSTPRILSAADPEGVGIGRELVVMVMISSRLNLWNNDE